MYLLFYFLRVVRINISIASTLSLLSHATVLSSKIPRYVPACSKYLLMDILILTTHVGYLIKHVIYYISKMGVFSSVIDDIRKFYFETT